MIARSRFVFVPLAAVLSCGGVAPPVEERSTLAAILPVTSEFTGWTITYGPIEHTPDNLFEYLDGGAERYLSNGFRELVHVRYQLGSDPSACVTLDVYHMGSELGAFGIYSAARRPEFQAEGWGSDGYRTGVIAAAWKGPIAVHAEADDERPELIEFLERVVDSVCERVPGEASAPSVLDPLPIDGRVARSERYVPADLLGHAFLPGGVLATYEVDGHRAELYLSDLGFEAAAEAALGQLRAHLESRGTIEPEPPPLAGEAFHYHDRTIGDGTAVRVGNSIAGIQGDLGPTVREQILQSLIDSLS